MQDLSAIIQALPVPLPVTPPETLPTDTKGLCLAINDCFNEAIQVYEPETQEFLKRIYYKGKHIYPVENLFETKGFRANWSVRLYANLSFDIHIEVDPRLAKSPVLHHLSLLHEIAAHAGQIRTLLTWGDILLCHKQELLHDPAFMDFLEQCAARMEKPLIDAIPDNVIEEACTLIPAPWGERFRTYHHHKQTLSTDEYVALRHRLPAA